MQFGADFSGNRRRFFYRFIATVMARFAVDRKTDLPFTLVRSDVLYAGFASGVWAPVELVL